MKRNAAIIGPTPQFVRWAIDHSCPFRDIDLGDLAKTTFRQLRSLRALSEGIREERVFEEICVHESVEIVHPDFGSSPARGFLVNEIYSVFGGRQFLQSCCGRCPANADDGHGDAWAGCFGWLAADLGWEMSPIQIEERSIEENLVQIFSNIVLELRDDFERCFESLPANWYGLWMPKIFSSEQVRLLAKVFAIASRSISTGSKQIRSFQQLSDAIQRCNEYDLNLHAELVPAGYSDGVRWKILAHCPDCKCVPHPTAAKRCAACNSERKPVQARYQKVLGFQPFLMLEHLLGGPDAFRFIRRYLKRKNLSDSG